MTNLIINALITKYQAHKSESLLRFNSYLTNSKAIPDHSDILKEVSKALEDLVFAEAMLAKLQETIDSIQPETNTES